MCAEEQQRGSPGVLCAIQDKMTSFCRGKSRPDYWAQLLGLVVVAAMLLQVPTGGEMC